VPENSSGAEPHCGVLRCLESQNVGRKRRRAPVAPVTGTLLCCAVASYSTRQTDSTWDFFRAERLKPQVSLKTLSSASLRIGRERNRKRRKRTDENRIGGALKRFFPHSHSRVSHGIMRGDFPRTPRDTVKVDDDQNIGLELGKP
jgi:hypothetical protein